MSSEEFLQSNLNMDCAIHEISAREYAIRFAIEQLDKLFVSYRRAAAISSNTEYAFGLEYAAACAKTESEKLQSQLSKETT